MSDDTDPTPYTESDILDTFADLTEAVGTYAAVFEIRNAKPELVAQMHKEALANLLKVHARAEDILAWITAEADDEIDDAALDDALDDLDEDDEDEDDDDFEDDEEEE